LDSNRETKTTREDQGYLIAQNPDSGRWEIFWRECKQKVDFARAVEAEDASHRRAQSDRTEKGRRAASLKAVRRNLVVNPIRRGRRIREGLQDAG
jgi:hypothetical protein